MAKISRIEKSRKEVRCSKCGKTLPVGSPYLKATPYHRSPIIRCVNCGLRSWETSGSDFVQTCGRISEDWKEDYGTDVDSIKTDLEELRDTCQDSFDNIPESLQYGPTGEMLEERIEMLDDVINELDNISDYDDIRQEVEEAYRTENDIDDETEFTEDQEAEIDSLVDDEITQLIDEALSNLSY